MTTQLDISYTHAQLSLSCYEDVHCLRKHFMFTRPLFVIFTR